MHIQKGPNGFVLRFEKWSGSELKLLVAARLVLETKGDQLSIVEESDDVTEARLKDAPPHDCAEAVDRIVSRHPVIEADEERVAREMPYFHPGGLYYDEKPSRDHFSASRGYFSEDRYDARWWVEAAEGTLTIRDGYTGALLPLTTKQKANVRQMCPGKAEDPDATGN